MSSWIALALLAQSPPVAVTNSTPPPIVAVPSNMAPPLYAIPGPAAPPGPPTPPLATIVRQPQARTPLRQLIKAEDYPASALAQRKEGRVAFLLDVGPDGRVYGCMIGHSSGSAALDSATCTIMRRRARFTPAIDSQGMPVAARVSSSFEWKLPEPAERG